MPRWLALPLGLLLVSCASRPARVVMPALAPGLDAFLAAHPLAPEQALRADEVTRTATASYHVVQIRGRESPHRHRLHDLTVFVLRGHGTLTLGAVRFPLAAGDAALIPREAEHWFRNDGRSSAVALVVFSPPLDQADSVPVER